MRKSLSMIACAILGCVATLEAASSYQTTQTAPSMTGSPAVMDVNTHTFQQTLSSTSKPIVLVFSASWCKPCQSMKPIVEEIAREMPDVTFLRVDFDASPEIVQSYHIDSIPAILFIRPDGYVVDRTVGYSEKQQLKGRVQAFSASMRK